jgi:signal peptidase
MKQKCKSTNILANLLPYLIFILAFVLIIDAVWAIKNRQIPTIFGYGAAIVLTNSMEDAIMTGDLIFIETVDASTLKVGDIITYWQPSAQTSVTITHRIIAITETPEGRLLSTKGDNNNASLSWELNFPETQYIGKYVGKSTFLGSIYGWFISAGVGVIYLFVILIFFSIVLMEGKNIIKQLTIARTEQLQAQRQVLIDAELKRLREVTETEKPIE